MEDDSALKDIETSAKDCLLNAEQHLTAAKTLQGLGADFYHIAYHNAVICLDSFVFGEEGGLRTLFSWTFDDCKERHLLAI